MLKSTSENQSAPLRQHHGMSESQLSPAGSARFPAGSQLRRRRAAAAVEFAVILPVNLLLLFGAIEVGCAMNIQSALQNAARETARHAITATASSSTCAEIHSHVVTTQRVKETTLSMSPDPSLAKSGTFISVTVSAPYAANSWLPSPGLLAKNVLSANVVMRKE